MPINIGGAASPVYVTDETDRPVKGGSAQPVYVVNEFVSSGGAWGDITGTLADQTDLQTALDAKAALGANTFTGAQNLADNLLVRAFLQDYGIKVNAIGSIGGGTQDIDFTLGNVVTATVDTAETTFTFSNPPPAGYEGQVKMYLTNAGSQTLNWPVNMNWAGGVEPTWTAAGVDIIVVTTPDNGTSYYGFVAGLDMS